MRIGTWNVECAAGAEKNARRMTRIREMDCDIWVLTETHDDLDPGGYFSASTTPRAMKRAGARWTTIWSRFPITKKPKVDDPNRTVAALVDSPAGSLLIYGTVIPWHSDPGPKKDARGWAEHHRIVPLQGREWARLTAAHPGASLCVAGDLNMNLGGPHYYGTAKGREMLRDGMKSANLVCVTETGCIPKGLLAHGPIDHVCLSEPLAGRARVDRAWEGRDGVGSRLSDHSGLVVSIAERARA